MVARTLLDGLRESLHDQEQTEGMLDHMSRLLFQSLFSYTTSILLARIFKTQSG